MAAEVPARRRLGLVAAVGFVIVVVDQITKSWALGALDDRNIDLFWTLRFRLIFNTGSAFGLGESFGRWLAVLVAVAVVGGFIYARGISDRISLLLIGVIMGGAIGNLIDRVFRSDHGFLSGAVVDFIDFQWWPVFNVADIAVVAGAIGLGVRSVLVAEP